MCPLAIREMVKASSGRWFPCSRKDHRRIHSSKLTWKWRKAPYKTNILYMGPPMSFHVNLGEGISQSMGERSLAFRPFKVDLLIPWWLENKTRLSINATHVRELVYRSLTCILWAFRWLL